jgi:hypothetical protein
MKKLLVLSAIAFAIVAIAASHTATAGGKDDNNGKKAEKVNICHNADVIATKTGRCILKCPLGQKGIGTFTVTVYEGQVINVNANAANAHYNHGDAPASASLSAGDTCRFSTRSACTGKCKGKSGPKDMAQSVAQAAAQQK